MKLKQALPAIAGILLAGAAYGGTVQYGAWYAGYDDGYVHAGTVNASGSVFAHICRTRCIWTITVVNRTCQVGSSLAIQAATDKGSASLSGECRSSDNAGCILRLENISQADLLKLAAEGSMIRFSIPTTDGRFHVIPFSLRGSTKALQAMYAVLSELQGQTTAEDTTEYDL